ncbi:MAG: hypothetical protein KDC53_03100 [Saprospiraceae bacterium]|nr:hypothetical protein [Saprospiraceae bacterium]
MKLIATNIKNLTDARFFAAYMPDMLVVPWTQAKDPVDILTWLDQVMPWIEGPVWAVEVPSDISGDDLLKIKDRGIKILIVKTEIRPVELRKDFQIFLRTAAHPTTKHDSDLFDGFIISDLDALSRVEEKNLRGEVFVELGSADDLSKVKPFLKQIDGFVLQGGDEEKVGIRSFDTLSDILEELRF